ncbi:DUF302 domain-containing protein [Nocardioides caricicola]|uniref:DUF302 domain-containing protein n=1 Tax=Nocardioides caricicola TaxID=634770 RepID=A0ABW0N6P6_9ACTN
MAAYTMRVTTPHPYELAVTAVRTELAEAGFGVITEIDLAATLKAKLDVDVAPQVILGACRPQLAHQAVQADPSIAALLPCNVVVRAVDQDTTVVEAFDPEAMIDFTHATDGDPLHLVAADARRRLATALEAVAAHESSTQEVGH